MRWLNQHPHQLVETSEHCSVPPLKYGGSPINRSSKRPSYARPRARRGAIAQKSGPVGFVASAPGASCFLADRPWTYGSTRVTMN